MILKHVERCRVLIHLVDISGLEGRDPIEDFELINKELYLYNNSFKDKVQIVALNKTDLDSNNNADKFIEKYLKTNIKFLKYLPLQQLA